MPDGEVGAGRRRRETDVHPDVGQGAGHQVPPRIRLPFTRSSPPVAKNRSRVCPTSRATSLACAPSGTFTFMSITVELMTVVLGAAACHCEPLPPPYAELYLSMLG